jgi:argininosuccinate synthase
LQHRMATKIVLGYSGGLDTTTAILWLKEKYGYDVVTLTIDVGQEEDFAPIAKRSQELGAIKHYEVDAKEEFANAYIAKSIRANGLYQGKYPLSTALARPLIAAKMVEVAEKEGATAVAHGCTGKGNDQVRFDLAVSALNPNLKVIAPVREWNLSRNEEVAYLRSKGFDAPMKRSEFSVDQNLWGRSVEGGSIENPADEPPQEALEWTQAPDLWPNQPSYVTIGFQEGVPTSLDGHEMKLTEIIVRLNRLAGSHGVGVLDHMEDRSVGIKSHEVYECPAATVLIEAHRELEKLVLTRSEAAFKPIVEQQWAWLVYSGLWIDPLLRDLQCFIDSTQEFVTGETKVKLFKGACRVTGRSSPFALYQKQLSTYGIDSTFDQKAAEGFIKLWGLPSVMAARRSLLKTKEVLA